MKKRVAVIDLGTNTFHLLIAEVNGGYRIIRRERAPVKIGMGGINEGFLTDEAMQRALAALIEFKSVLDREQVREVRVFGTSALRNARNGNLLAARVLQETGLGIKIISGDEEADLIYQGVRLAGVLSEQAALIVDIGGGSVEFIIGNREKISWKHSFEIGAQRLLERFQKHDPIRAEEVKLVNDYLRQALAPLWAQLKIFRPSVLVGSSGTFDTLSEIHCIRNHIPYPAEAPETPLSFRSFDEIFPELLSKDRARRLAIPGMIEMRVDMIVVACCLIRLLIDQHTFQAIKVSTYSLKEGALAGAG